jgi:hypothetical protein
MSKDLKFLRWFWFICVVWSVATILTNLPGCSTVQKSDQVEVVDEKLLAPENGWHTEAYESYIEKEVAKLPEHMKYNSNPKYWAKFYKSLSAAESSFKPFTTYHETTLGNGGIDPWAKKKGFKDTTYWSMGLFQLSYSDSEYYSCPFDWEADRLKDMKDKSNSIYVPKNQFDCAFKIMERLLAKNGTPFFDSKNYWIVLKPGSRYAKYHKNFLYYFNQWGIK